MQVSGKICQTSIRNQVLGLLSSPLCTLFPYWCTVLYMYPGSDKIRFSPNITFRIKSAGKLLNF